MCKFGIPKKIVSNFNPRFDFKFLTTLRAKLSIKVGLSLWYHLQTDGQSKRFHRLVDQVM